MSMVSPCAAPIDAPAAWFRVFVGQQPGLGGLLSHKKLRQGQLTNNSSSISISMSFINAYSHKKRFSNLESFLASCLIFTGTAFPDRADLLVFLMSPKLHSKSRQRAVHPEQTRAEKGT
jgi:hypothetical protein